jgi:hypothetical protein
MQLINLLLLFVLSATSAFAEGSLSDTWRRDLAVTHFTVYPKNPTHIPEITEIETQLKTLCGDANVIRRPGYDDEHSSSFHTWTVTAPASQDMTSLMKDVHSVRLIEPSESAEITELSLEHVELTRRDVGVYQALATTATDIQKTEDFIKSKIEPGSLIRQFKYRGEVIGWWNLTLSQEAKDAVQKYRGIEAMRTGGTKIQEFSALPISMSPRHYVLPPVPFHDKGTLSRRSITWVKQFDADKALVEDSRYL